MRLCSRAAPLYSSSFCAEGAGSFNSVQIPAFGRRNYRIRESIQYIVELTIYIHSLTHGKTT